MNVQDAEIEGEGEGDDDEMEYYEDDEREQMEFPGTMRQREAKAKAQLYNMTSVSPKSASIITTSSDDPIRYLLPLSSSSDDEDEDEDEDEFVMIDVPPYSQELHAQILTFLNKNKKNKSNSIQQPLAILITNKNSLHYDESPAVYTSRNSDLKLWIQAFPDIEVVMHRIDIPRDLNDVMEVTMRDENDEAYIKRTPIITQVLDGYGPWAWDMETNSFVESGKPLTVLEWDDDKITEFFEAGMEGSDDETSEQEELAQIKAKEEGKSLLAVYTPGHTMGSMSYILPNTQICASGFTIPPPEQSRSLDYKGYISTNRATIERQVQSARDLNVNYVDRFAFVLPSRGNYMDLNDQMSSVEDDDSKKDSEKQNQGSKEQKQQHLDDIIALFEKIGNIYDSLGITNRS